METPSIDYMNPLIHDKVQELMNQSEDNLDYIKLCYSLSGMKFLTHGTLKQI